MIKYKLHYYFSTFALTVVAEKLGLNSNRRTALPEAFRSTSHRLYINSGWGSAIDINADKLINEFLDNIAGTSCLNYHKRIMSETKSRLESEVGGWTTK